MNVILDTNILISDPFFKNTDMRRLINLAKIEVINLIIPDIVLNEFKTNKIEEYKKSYLEYERKINEIFKKSKSEKENQLILKSIELFNNSIKYLHDGLQKRVEDFLNSTKATIVKNKPKDLEKMLEMYFKGEAPFKNIKSKDEFPDCLIYLLILDFEKAYVISNDKFLKNTIKKKHPVFGSIELFLSSTENIIKKETDIKYIQLLQANICKIENKILNLLENDLTNTEFTDDSIPDDNHKGYLAGTPTIETLHIDASSIQDNGYGFYSFYFEAEFENLVEYFMHKSDYCFSDFEKISITEWNEHYFQAEEEMQISCTGRFSLEIDLEKIDFDNFEEITNKAKFSFNEIELSVK